MSLKKIVQDVHILVNMYRVNHGKEPLNFPDRSEYFMSEATLAGTQAGTNIDDAPYCQCTNCQKTVEEGHPELAKKVKMNHTMEPPQWNKYGHGHKPADGKFHPNKRNPLIDKIPTEDLFTVKVYESKEYAAKNSDVDERFIAVLRQVNNGDDDEVTCLYPQAEYIKYIYKQLCKGVDILKYRIKVEKVKDHIKLTKLGIVDASDRNRVRTGDSTDRDEDED